MARGVDDQRDIVRRWSGNPVITLDDLAFQCTDVCNAGVTKTDGEYILLVTVQSLEGFYAIYPARGSDGYHFTMADEPVLSPSSEESYRIHEAAGVLDPRIVPLDGWYYICYDAAGPHGYRMALARTKDFAAIERVGLLSAPDTKGGVLFPRKIGGRYARLERPWEASSIWVSYSDDLEYWGYSEVVMTPRAGFWDCNRIGTATPPMEIDEGWLEIYYGVKTTSAGPLFRLGAAILNEHNPAQVEGRTNVPILAPRETYERIGDLPNRVFSCGAVIEPDGEIKLYYGGADSCICVGMTTVEDVVRACHESAREF